MTVHPYDGLEEYPVFCTIDSLYVCLTSIIMYSLTLYIDLCWDDNRLDNTHIALNYKSAIYSLDTSITYISLGEGDRVLRSTRSPTQARKQR